MRILIGALAMGLLAGCGDGDIKKAHNEVEKLLYDDGSAKFRNDRVLFVPPTQDKIVCGEVNAKNRLGAYVGFTPYVVENLDRFPVAKFSSESASDIKITCSLGKSK